MARGEPDVLYHYTDAGGFAGIIEHCKLWATDIRFLNDPLELKYAWDELLVTLEAAKAEKPQYAEAYEAMLQAISMTNAVDPDAIEDRIFSTSFSADGDDYTQWRMYAEDARGMALGFDTDCIGMLRVPYFHHAEGGRLVQMEATISETNQQVPFMWGGFTQQVRYGDAARKNAIDGVLYKIERSCEENGVGTAAQSSLTPSCEFRSTCPCLHSSRRIRMRANGNGGSQLQSTSVHAPWR